MADINKLNSNFSIDGHVSFVHGEGGFTKAVLTNATAGSSLEVYLHGIYIIYFF